MKRWLWRMALRHLRPRGPDRQGEVCLLNAQIAECQRLQQEPRFKGALSVPAQLERRLHEEARALAIVRKR